MSLSSRQTQAESRGDSGFKERGQGLHKRYTAFWGELVGSVPLVDGCSIVKTRLITLKTVETMN